MKEVQTRRVRIEYVEGSKDLIRLVDDPNGAFKVYVQPDIRLDPKTKIDLLTELADAGELPIGDDPNIPAQWSKWTRGICIPGNGGVYLDGEYRPGSQRHILDYQYFDETRKHSCPLRMVVDGVLYYIPRPADDPAADR